MHLPVTIVASTLTQNMKSLPSLSLSLGGHPIKWSINKKRKSAQQGSLSIRKTLYYMVNLTNSNIKHFGQV